LINEGKEEKRTRVLVLRGGGVLHSADAQSAIHCKGHQPERESGGSDVQEVLQIIHGKRGLRS